MAKRIPANRRVSHVSRFSKRGIPPPGAGCPGPIAPFGEGRDSSLTLLRDTLGRIPVCSRRRAVHQDSISTGLSSAGGPHISRVPHSIAPLAIEWGCDGAGSSSRIVESSSGSWLPSLRDLRGFRELTQGLRPELTLPPLPGWCWGRLRDSAIAASMWTEGEGGIPSPTLRSAQG
jgi:hypothetical protein